MTFERADYKDLLNKKKTERVREQKTSLEMLRRAEVGAKFLTNDENWDVYLSYIQNAIERTEAQLSAFKEGLCDPNITNTDEIMRIKIHAATCAGRIEAMKAMRALPKELMTAGAQARQLLDTIDETDALQQ